MRAILLVCALSAAAEASADSLVLGELQTDELRLLYQDPQQTYLTPYVARCFLNSLEFQKRIFRWAPYEKVTVVFTDLSDYGNGAALVSPQNIVATELSPTSHVFETMPSSERFHSLANHELVHIATMDAWNQKDRAWRRFFGGKPKETNEHPESIAYNYLATPRRSTPRWYTEGSAVFMETWLSGGIGRAQGGYDEMVFRAMVRDDAHFYSALGVVSQGTANDFQTMTTAYLYGTRFFSYLGLVYSPELVVEWLSRGEQSDRYYGNQFERVFKKPLEQVWGDWIVWEHGFQKKNLEALRKYPLTAGRRVSPQILGSISKSYVDSFNNTMVGAFLYPGVVSHVGTVSLTDGSVQRVVDIKGPMKYLVTSTAFDQQSRTFFYTADNVAFRDLMALDLATGKSRMLLKDARIGDLAFNPADRSLMGVRHENGYATLVKIPPPYNNWQQVITLPYGQVLSDLDISPDGKSLSVTMEEIDAKQYLRVYSIEALLGGKFEPFAQFDFGVAIPEGFVFSNDGRFLYGSSYYTGVSNIFRFELATSEIQAVTNAETGFFRPIPQADGTLLALEYSGTGFVPMIIGTKPLEDLSAITFLGTEIANQHPIVKTWNAGSPADIPLDSMITERGKYIPMKQMKPDGGYPIVEGYLDSVALGWKYGFADPLHLYNFDVSASYTVDGNIPDSERLHVRADFKTLDWHAMYWHNIADFYDLFGPTKRSRKGDALGLGYKKLLLYDEPRRLQWSAAMTYYTGLDTLPGNQNVSDTLDQLLAAKIGLEYSNTRKSQASVDHEKGYDWSMFLLADRANGETIPKAYISFDFGFALPLKNSSIWLYNSAGGASGDPGNSLANFYFGGFQNNYVDDGEVKRYRQFQTFPGFEIDALGGQRFLKTVLEWNAPPFRFEGIGTPGFYLSYIRPAVFASNLVIDESLEGGRRTYNDIGLQLDLNFTILDHLPMTVSFGYAQGFEDSHEVGDEWLFSLKVL
jgi:hypothetical protein